MGDGLKLMNALLSGRSIAVYDNIKNIGGKWERPRGEEAFVAIVGELLALKQRGIGLVQLLHHLSAYSLSGYRMIVFILEIHLRSIRPIKIENQVSKCSQCMEINFKNWNGDGLAM